MTSCAFAFFSASVMPFIVVLSIQSPGFLAACFYMALPPTVSRLGFGLHRSSSSVSGLFSLLNISASSSMSGGNTESWVPIVLRTPKHVRNPLVPSKHINSQISF